MASPFAGLSVKVARNSDKQWLDVAGARWTVTEPPAGLALEPFTGTAENSAYAPLGTARLLLNGVEVAVFLYDSTGKRVGGPIPVGAQPTAALGYILLGGVVASGPFPS